MNEMTPLQLQLTLAREELRCCDDLNRLHGLTLTEEDITDLIQCRGRALRDTGRVELGGGILPKLIRAFCSSPYIDPRTYAATLAELQDAFYYFKNESLDTFSDDELIEFMAKVFNGPAAGSAELLSSLSLEELCRWVRNADVEGFEEEAWECI